MISRAEQVVNYAILSAFAVFALVPVLVIAVGAVQPQTVGAGGIHLENFAAAWQRGHLDVYLRTSVLVAAIVVPTAVVLSVMSGYALGTMRFAGATPLFYAMLAGIMVPTEAIVVPLYFDLRSVGLTDTLWALVLPQVAQSVAFGTFWMRAYFLSTSRALVEAARLDGAGHWRTLWHVLVPLGRPALVTMVVLIFMWTWNEFLIPLVMVVRESLRTAPLGLTFFQGQYTQGFSLLAAAALIVALPVVVVYLFLQRHFIRGMLEGALKE